MLTAEQNRVVVVSICDDLGMGGDIGVEEAEGIKMEKDPLEIWERGTNAH